MKNIKLERKKAYRRWSMGMMVLLATISIRCTPTEATEFASVKNGQFIVDGKPYYFIGTNFWYGAILGSNGQGGNRERLLRELDFLKANGIGNLRILIGADGENGVPSKVEPTLQTAPGVYNDTIFDGLDYLIAEMGKRNMKAVLYFTNAWEWSGGYSQYLNWLGKGKNPIPSVDGWPAYIEYVRQYANCSECHELLKKHIKHIITRTNRYTGIKYTDDATIFSWQIGNEPRAFSDENKNAFAAWLKDIAAYIKSLDSKHMVSVGSEGKHGCEQDIELFELIHTDPNSDYLTMHVWPKNWSWLDVENIMGTLQVSINNTIDYMNLHIEVARKLKKPVVMEEFGFPRDNHRYTPDDPTTARDAYYAAVFDQIAQAANKNDVLAGCNFWSWAGYARPRNLFWQPGDDFMGDPAQEEQGLNAVYNIDPTVLLVKKYSVLLNNKPLLADLHATERTVQLFRTMGERMNEGIMVGHQDDLAYGHGWYAEEGRSDVLEVTGRYPSVTGWEIGHLETGAPYNLDSVSFTNMKKWIREVDARGGINTISWHGNNIVTGNSTWDHDLDTVVRSILPSGFKHEEYLVWLDRLADFFLDLKDQDDRLIPVIFRMYHEHTGSWFWWGAKQCTPDEYKELFRMTVSYLRDKRNVHNILYAYSPAGISTEEEFLERYPGDEWVDLIGFDTYLHDYENPNSIKSYIKSMTSGLKVITEYAKKSGKIPALTETGLEGVSISDYFTRIVLPTIEPFKISYILFWRNAFNLPNHFYVPYKGHPAADDFKKFCDSEKILMINNNN
jgi:mannan endo-1,4-beta-mannosidase